MAITPCRVAVIGAGNMGREHVRAFSDVPGVRVVGIHSRTRARAELLAEEYGLCSVYDSVAELYERTEAHLVVVAVSVVSMAAVSQACFEHPWTVLLEKPPGCDLEEAEEIYLTAKRHSRRVLVGLNRRFLSSTRAVMDDMTQQAGPRFIHVQDQEDQCEAASMKLPKKVVDNWMYANSIHVVDYLRIFGRGDVLSVSPVIDWLPGESNVVVSKVVFDSGDVGLYQGIWRGPGPWAVSISTPQKRWEMRPLEQAVSQLNGERRLNPAEVHQWDREFKPGFRLQAEMAVSAALGKPSESPTLEEGMGTMKLIAKIFAQ